MNIDQFATEIEGKEVSLFKLSNDLMSCYVTNYGARVVSLIVRNSSGTNTDVVLGFNNLDGYLNANEQYHGATIGRFANRIAKGKFKINEEDFILEMNNGPNSLHGGGAGFHAKVWDVIKKEESQIVLEYTSPDMEEGFPGELVTRITYKLENGDLNIQYSAVSNKDTIINLTHHSYFNLNGEGQGTILNHLLELNCDYFTAVNEHTIPTGKLELVHGTPFDFTVGKRIGAQINEEDDQLKKGFGYDHNLVVNRYQKDELTYVGFAKGDITQITMEVWSTEPGVQLYTANHLNGMDVGKSGLPYKKREAFCLETQHFPDSPNHHQFPSTILPRGKEYESTTIYRFKELL